MKGPSPNRIDDDDCWLLAQEVAELLRVDVRTVYEWCRRKDLRYARTRKGGQLRVLRSWLNQWMESGAKAPKEPK